ncbi:MAG: WecB/TagA/CpsF family glycosyltransferase [Patescibacteria group bacterium]
MVNILGINLSEFKESEVLKKIADFLVDGQQHYIVTPNPEIILAAGKDEEFAYVLNEATLALADGFGLKLACLLFGRNLPRVTGADLTAKLLAKAREQKIKIAVLNWAEGLSKQELIATALNKYYPGLDFLIIDTNRDKLLTTETINQINNFAPKVLFCTLGFPYQEKVLFYNLKKLVTVKVALAIGGSFDFITGQTKRAPKILRNLGLEWLWRVIKEPKRIKRIYRATFVFLGKILKIRFFNPYLYRPNVACLLYKKNQGKNKILLIERADEPGHWQLPQGGTDGESLEQAGARELREEIGTTNFTTKAIFKNLYRYRFPRNSEHKKYCYNYKGQEQGLYVAEFTGTDNDLKIRFWDHIAWKWVDADNLVGEIHPVRETGSKIFLAKFKSLNL